MIPAKEAARPHDAPHVGRTRQEPSNQATDAVRTIKRGDVGNWLRLHYSPRHRKPRASRELKPVWRPSALNLAVNAAYRACAGLHVPSGRLTSPRILRGEGYYVEMETCQNCDVPLPRVARPVLTDQVEVDGE